MMTLEKILLKIGKGFQKMRSAIITATKPRHDPLSKEDRQWLKSLPTWPSNAASVEAISNSERVTWEISQYIERFPDDATYCLESIKKSLQEAILRRDAEDAARLLYIKAQLSRRMVGCGKTIER